jgi:hypothetical protein
MSEHVMSVYVVYSAIMSTVRYDAIMYDPLMSEVKVKITALTII